MLTHKGFELRTKDEALLQGFLTYMTERKCTHGHYAPRLAHSRQCTECLGLPDHHQLCVYEVQYAYPSGSTESPFAAAGIQWVVTSSPKRAAEFAIELNGDHILVTDVHYVRNYNVED